MDELPAVVFRLYRRGTSRAAAQPDSPSPSTDSNGEQHESSEERTEARRPGPGLGRPGGAGRGSFLREPPDPIWDGSNYSAPLCTSCNESGHPDGSIVKRDVALAFAEAQRIGVVLTCNSTATELGSYPIFGFERNRVSVHSDGPGLATFKARIPERLCAW